MTTANELLCRVHRNITACTEFINRECMKSGAETVVWSATQNLGSLRTVRNIINDAVSRPASFGTDPNRHLVDAAMYVMMEFLERAVVDVERSMLNGGY